MAYNDSSEIAWGSGYNLGEYSFSLERTSVPGSTNDQITAVCRQGGKSARKSIQVPSSAQISGWYVEANDTEASVYITTDSYEVSGGDEYIASGSYGPVIHTPNPNILISRTASNSGDSWAFVENSTNYLVHVISRNYGSATVHVVDRKVSDGSLWYEETRTPTAVVVHGITFYSSGANVYARNHVSGSWGPPSYYGDVRQFIESELLEKVEESKIVGRFAIDIGDAGGYPGGGGDGGGDWTEPGDYDPDWDPEDPTTTLHIEVVGALSGRHNDPLNDTRYSYLPSDKDTVKQYGCGGDGGHGGGGGAGASTVLVHRIATNKANSHEVIALARRHGYGSGGGKGGRGGDGIILIYY